MKLLLLAVLLAGCAASAPTPAPIPVTHVLAGTFTLRQKEPVIRYSNATGCNGTGGYNDITEGLDVTVKDDAGKIVGTSHLLALPIPSGAAPYTFERTCNYAFGVTVPDAPFYSVEVGHRGALTKSRAELAATGWAVEMTLGG